MSFLLLKALHVFGFVAWFAGLFYILRLFIYFTEAQDQPAAAREILQKQFVIMQRRLFFGITWPAMIFTWACGITMAIQRDIYLQPWFHLKLALLFALVGYHLYCHRIMRALWRGEYPLSPQKLRWLNELATIFLFSIAFTAVFKQLVFSVWALVGVGIISLLLAVGIVVYARKRRRDAMAGADKV